jgi:signal transduction histidine kinase/CheY-like chemotaxis protein
MAVKSAWKKYTVAVLAVGAGALARVPLWSVLGDGVPFITFFPAIVWSAWYGGFRAGMLTTLLAAVACDWFFLEPRHALGMTQPNDIASFVLFVGMGALISRLGHDRNMAIDRLRAAHQREQRARVEAQQTAARVEGLRVEAEAANRSKDEFLAMLGHELRNPLAPMVTALELIRHRNGGQLGRLEQVIARQVHHLSRMVDDLLDVSRIARGLVTLSRKSIEIGPVITRALEIASPLLESRRHHVTSDVLGGLLVHGDPDRLAQVFANLLTNAAKYTDPGGRVDVSAKRESNTIVVRIRDNGLGMSPDLLAKVFDLFVQGAQGVERRAGGLGIGLTLVRSLVTLHGGEVEAHSEGIGRGSEMVVRLPALKEREAKALPAGREEGAPPERLSARRVLVVDDNEDAATSLAEMLRARGLPVVVAFDGPQALSMLDSFEPDVAVLDIGLPVMDGYELASRIRERLGSDSPRLVAVTGYGQEKDRENTREAGFEHHLVKPVSIDHLISIIAGGA